MAKKRTKATAVETVSTPPQARMEVPVVEVVSIDSLHLDPTNVRTHDQRNLDAIKASLATFGQQELLIVDEKNVVRAGNGRLVAAKQLGWTEIKIVRTTLRGVQAMAYAIASNRTSDLSSFDEVLLAQQLEALKSEEDFDLNVVGYSDDELENLLADLSDDLVGGEVDPDDLDDTGANGDKGDGLELIADVVRAEPKTKVEPGDVFKLGQHTLICCDVLKEWETYAPLMKPGYVFLPYPSPLIPLTATDKICVLVQPDTYLAAMTCDLFEAAHPGEKAHKL